MSNLTWERLDTLVESSLSRVTSGEFVSLAKAVKIILPDILLSLRELAKSGTPQQRQRAIDTVFLATEKIRAHELKLVKANAMRERHRAKTAKAQAERARAVAEKQKVTLVQAREHKRNRKKVEAAMAVLKAGGANEQH
jgi:hypothetical protein